MERDTDIQPGDTIVEFSSGNTAIGLAAIAAKRGYKMIAYMVQATPEREKLLRAYGAEVRDMLADAEVMKGMGSLPEDVDQVDVLIAGVGSGGSITGVSEALREKFPKLEVIAFEPTDDDPESLVGVHSISLTPRNSFPQIILRKDRTPYDRIIKVHKEDAYRMANKVARPLLPLAMMMY